MKVLFVNSTFPLPPHAGAKVALLETLRSIEDLCELHLLVPSPDAASRPLAAQLRETLPRTAIHFYEPGAPDQPTRVGKLTTAALAAASGRSYHATIWMDRNLRRAARELHAHHRFDVVHCEWLYPAIALHGLDLPAVVRTLDLHSALMRDGVAELPDSQRLRKSLWRVEAERFRRFEVGVLNDALLTISVSPEDEEALRREGVRRIVRVPPPMALPALPPPPPPRDECRALFLCMLHAYVNRESSFLFTDEILPLVGDDVRARVRVIFAGGNPDAGARRRAAECGIEMHAPLSDEEARALYADADIFISPIKTGTGIKTKTLEAMANAKPLVGFPNSFRGVPAENGRHALVAGTNEEFARLFERLVTQPDLRRRIGAAARDFIGVEFNPRTLGERLIETYEEALGGALRKRAAG